MLSRQSRIILDTLLPSGAHPALPLGLFEAGFDDFWADFERTTVPVLGWTFRAALFTAGWIAPLLIGRPPPLSRYDRQTREQALAALGASHSYLLRQMLAILKTTACYCYGAHANVRAAIGYAATPDLLHPPEQP